MNTRDKIRDKALELFNERGIEYVGLRELAAELGMRVSNITYYFPTKDDLVFDLAQELSRTNAALFRPDTASFIAFLEMMRTVYANQLRFRCLLLSVVHVLRQNKHLSDNYQKTQRSRRATIAGNLDALQAGGVLQQLEASAREFLVATLSLMGRFWISEAAISGDTASEEKQVARQLAQLAQLMLPYATAKGKREVLAFIE